MRAKIFLISFVFIFLARGLSFADEIILHSGNKIHGKIIKEDWKSIIIDTPAAGKLSIDKKVIAHYITEEEKKKAALRELDKWQRQKEVKKVADEWQRKFSLGYSQVGGNSESSQLTLGLTFDNKTGDDEWNVAVHSYSSTSSGKMDARKFDGSLRYANSHNKDKRRYTFYKMLGEQDRFADIDLRFIPSAGVGYWFLNREQGKWLLEGGLGWEHTNFRSDKESDNDVTFIPRTYVEKKIIGDLLFSNDASYYISIDNRGEYRMHNEMDLVNPVNDVLDLKLSLISDFNSQPPDDVKKRDYKFISSLEYSF